MKLLKLFTVVLMAIISTSLSHAHVDGNVQIIGKIGNAFDKEKVKVTDSHGQTYYVPKNLFPKDFKFKNGTAFNIEVSEEFFQTLPKPKH